MKKLIGFFVNNTLLTWIIVFCVAALGVFGAFHITRSFLPNSREKTIMIDVAYPGASPIEMEEGVTLKIENQLKGTPGIEEVLSTSSENTASITVITKREYQVDAVLDDVKNAVNAINSFPENAEKPKVYKQRQSEKVIYLVLSGEVDLMKLKEISDIVENDFLATGFISQIETSGVPSLEISIEIDENTLQEYQLTFDDIAQTIRQNNQDISGGSIKSDNNEILIRSRNKTTDINRINNFVIRSLENGNKLKLGDIATVKLQFSENNTNSILYNGKNAIQINIRKLVEEDLIQITDYAKSYAETYNKYNKSTQLKVISDRSVPLNQRIDILTKNGVSGLILVVICLSLFLNVRISLWVAFGIPISFLGMIFFADLAGFTINQISLFGMILVIGILVDDGIVIGENVYAKLEKGIPPIKAAIDGTMEVLPSVFTSVLTTMVAFTALFFLDSHIGEMIYQLGGVVIICLAISLVEATLILPSHLNFKPKSKPLKFKVKINQGMDFLRFNVYGKMLKHIIEWRIAMIALPILFISLVIGLIQGGHIGFSLFPAMDSNSITLELVLKQGTTENITKNTLLDIDKKIESISKELPKTGEDSLMLIQNTIIKTGSSSLESGSHTGQIVIELADAESRDISSNQIATMLKEKIGYIEGANKFVIGGQTFFGKPVSIRLLGRNNKELVHAKNQLIKYLEQIDELKDVVDNDILGKDEINIKLKPQAHALGLDEFQISNQIRQGFFGKEVQRLQLGEDEVKIWLRYPTEKRKYISQLENIKIKTSADNQILLKDLIDYYVEPGIITINHYNGAREISVEASMKNPEQALNPILVEINDEILPKLLANHPSVRMVKGGQEKEKSKLKDSMSIVVPVILLLTYLILIINCNSVSQPILIFILIAIGIFCALFGHFVEGKNFVIMSQFGMIGLIGIIVNDAVVFADKYNRNLKEGMLIKDAIFEAGISRFRPILLTSMTTVLGLYPLIFEKSIQAKFLIPMAISVVYGVLIGTFFILVFFPALLMILSDLRMGAYHLWNGTFASREELEPAIKRQKKQHLE